MDDFCAFAYQLAKFFLNMLSIQEHRANIGCFLSKARNLPKSLRSIFLIISTFIIFLNLRAFPIITILKMVGNLIEFSPYFPGNTKNAIFTQKLSQYTNLII